MAAMENTSCSIMYTLTTMRSCANSFLYSILHIFTHVQSGHNDDNLYSLHGQQQEEDQQHAPVEGSPAHIQQICVDQVVYHSEEVLGEDGQHSQHDQTPT